mmetsp:Transcript_41231/g.94848  ORF Transcript_41231/g.94848 Transcript_41231/m.94848 type:complete len:473 (+) Transcript_41231:219-1637(+)
MRAIQSLATLTAAPEAGASLDAPDKGSASCVARELQAQGVDVDSAIHDANALPITQVVLPRHPERTVILVHVAKRLLNSRVLLPQVTLVAPITCPFAASPRVSNLQHSECGATNNTSAHLLHMQDAVSVLLMKSVIATCSTGRQNAAQAVILQQHLKHGIIVNLFLGNNEVACSLILGILDAIQVSTVPSLLVITAVEHPGRVACHGMHCPNSCATLNAAIASTKLCKGFLQQHRPEFIATRLCEERLTSPISLVLSLVDGNVVIHNYVHPPLLNAVEEAQSVLSTRVSFLGSEDSVDAARVFRATCHSGQQPTIAKRTLANISAINLVLKELHPRGSWKTVGAHPNTAGTSSSCTGIGVVATNVAQGLAIWWEGAVRVQPAAVQHTATAATNLVEAAVKVYLATPAYIDAEGPDASDEWAEQEVPQTTGSPIQQIRPTTNQVFRTQAHDGTPSRERDLCHEAGNVLVQYMT